MNIPTTSAHDWNRAESVQTYVSRRDGKTRIQAISWSGRNSKEIRAFLPQYEIAVEAGRLVMIRPSDQRELKLRNGGFVCVLQGEHAFTLPCPVFLNLYIHESLPAPPCSTRKEVFDQFIAQLKARALG